MFLHSETRKISPICKISTFFEDLSILNPRNHLIIRRFFHSSEIQLFQIVCFRTTWKQRNRYYREELVDVLYFLNRTSVIGHKAITFSPYSYFPILLKVLGCTCYRSSHRRYSIKKGVLKSFAKFTGKHLCQGLFFNEVVGLRPATLSKKRLWHRCFLVNFAKFLRTSFLQNTPGRLLLLLFI